MGVGGFDGPEFVPPQSKLRGGAPAILLTDTHTHTGDPLASIRGTLVDAGGHLSNTANPLAHTGHPLADSGNSLVDADYLVNTRGPLVDPGNLC